MINTRHQRAFSLVEVLLAITLFSVITTLLYGGLYTAGRQWRATDARLEINEAQRLADNVVRRYVSQTVPLFMATEDESRLYFKGEPNTLEFVAQLPAHQGAAGLHFLTLETRWQDDGYAFVLAYRPVVMDAMAADANELVLIDAVQNAEFAYYGKADTDEDAAWHRAWLPDKYLATLIRVRLGAAARTWPDIVVPIHVRQTINQAQFKLPAPS